MEWCWWDCCISRPDKFGFPVLYDVKWHKEGLWNGPWKMIGFGKVSASLKISAYQTTINDRSV